MRLIPPSPREKLPLGDRIQMTILDVLECLINATYSKRREGFLSPPRFSSNFTFSSRHGGTTAISTTGRYAHGSAASTRRDEPRVGCGVRIRIHSADSEILTRPRHRSPFCIRWTESSRVYAPD